VYRALRQSLAEDERLGALDAGDPARGLAFTEAVRFALENALERLSGVLGDRVTTRAERSRAIILHDDLVDDATSVISAVRNHLYANLPLRKKDPDLRGYGFRPIRTGASSGASNDEEGDGEEAGESEE
jgi:hypothetical protein